MGNTVSAAELAATQIIHPQTPTLEKPDHTKFLQSGYAMGDIPPECPMHKKQTASVCPVKEGTDDLNPLNMVI